MSLRRKIKRNITLKKKNKIDKKFDQFYLTVQNTERMPSIKPKVIQCLTKTIEVKQAKGEHYKAKF